MDRTSSSQKEAQSRAECFDEFQKRFAYFAFVAVLVFLEPLAVVVVLELLEERDEFGLKMSRLGHAGVCASVAENINLVPGLAEVKEKGGSRRSRLCGGC